MSKFKIGEEVKYDYLPNEKVIIKNCSTFYPFYSQVVPNMETAIYRDYTDNIEIKYTINFPNQGVTLFDIPEKDLSPLAYKNTALYKLLYNK